MKFVKLTKVGAALCGAFGLTAFGEVSPEGVADITADISVDSGTVEFAGKGAAADAEYPDGFFATDARSFHLDATKNLVFDDNGTLVAWLDARETPCADYAEYQARCESQGFSYPRAIVYVDAEDPDLSSVPPEVKNDVAFFGDKRYVDFGEYGDNGSHMWLLFVNKAGNRMRIVLQAMVGAVGFGKSAGFLLGDVDDPAKCGTAAAGNGQPYFHKGAGGGTGENDAIYTAFPNCPTPYYGETLLDGRRVTDPSVTKHIRNGWELFTQNGPSGNAEGQPFVSTLFNLGNFKKKSGVNDRQGGGKVGEIIYFSRVLTEAERMQVEAYLNQKWFGRCTAGTVTVAAGATAAVSAATDTSVESFAGAGDVSKTGDGRLQIRSNASLLNGSLAIEKGRVEVMGGNLDFPPVRATAGQRMTATVNALEPSATAARADEFAIDGDAATKVTLTEIGADVTRLSASAGILSVKAPASGERRFDFFSSGTNLIVNGDFEADTVPPGTANGFVQQTPSGWTKAVDVSTVGYCIAGSAFCNGSEGTPYSGENCYYNQTDGNSADTGVKQTVDIPYAGLYTLSFAMRSRQRGNYDENDQTVLTVYAGDRVVIKRVTDDVVNGSNWKVRKTEHYFQHESVDVWLDKGPVTLKFLGRGSPNLPTGSSDRALLLDDIRLTPKRDGVCAILADPSFDSISEVVPYGTEGGIYKSSPAGSPWTFGAEEEATHGAPCEAGISRFPSHMCYFAEDGTTEPMSDKDHQQLYLHRHAWATAPIEFPTDGRVMFSIRAARGGFGRSTGSVLYVKIDDVNVMSVTPGNTSLTKYENVLSVTKGQHVLKIEAVPPDDLTKDYVLGVDDVDFRYLGQEQYAPIRDFSGPHWEVVPETVTPGVIAYLGGGSFEAQLRGDAGVRQTFVAPEDGVYAFVADLVGRSIARTRESFEYHTATNFPHYAGLYVDGVKAVSFAVEDTDCRRFSFRLPYLTAGEHVLTIKGDDVQTGASSMSRVRNPELFMLETAEAAPDLTGKEIILKDGAKLNLDMPGTTRLGKLRVNGKTVGGTFSASNCDFITGSGEVVSEIPGCMILLR